MIRAKNSGFPGGIPQKPWEELWLKYWRNTNKNPVNLLEKKMINSREIVGTTLLEIAENFKEIR